MRIFDELNMKKFNPQVIFFHFLLICLIIFNSSCHSNSDFTTVSGKKVRIEDNKLSVFIFLNTECPVCRKYQGEFKKMHSQNAGTPFYFVFSGKQDKQAILDFCAYDSLSDEMIIVDDEFRLANRLDAMITPQAIIRYRGESSYSGKIDDRFETLGSSKPVTINYVNKALISLIGNEDVEIPRTEAVGCFIEPR